MAAFTDEELAVLESGSVSVVGLVRVALTDGGTLRIWTGVGDLPIRSSAFDEDGAIYLGGGRLLEMPAFSQLVNAIAEQSGIAVTGLTAQMRRLVSEEAHLVIGAEIRAGLVYLGAEWQQIGAVHWLKRGKISDVDARNEAGGGKRMRTAVVSFGTHAVGRRVPGYGTWTSQDQRSRPGSEDDRACEGVARLVGGVQKPWP